MKRILIALLAVVMLLGMIAPLASAEEPTEVTSATVYVKQYAYDTAKIHETLRAAAYTAAGVSDFGTAWVQWSIFPNEFKESGSVYVNVTRDTGTTRYIVPYEVCPATDYVFDKEAPLLTIDDAYNASADSMLSYMNLMRPLKACAWSNPSAIGSVHPVNPEPVTEMTPAWTGGANTYTATFTYDSKTFTQTVTVLDGPVTLRDVVVNVKYKPADFEETLKLLKEKLTGQVPAAALQSVEWSNVPTKFETQGVMEAKVTDYLGNEQLRKVTYKVIKPEGYELAVPTLEPIKATDDQNKDAEALLAYLNSNLDIKILTSEDYNNALGTAPTLTLPAFTVSDIAYKSQGGTYTLSVRYESSRLVRTLNVAFVENDSPAVYINYSNGTLHILEDKENVSYATTKSSTSWIALEDGTAIKDAWLGKDLFIRREGTTYKVHSAVVTVPIPKRPDAPEAKPEVRSSSRSITLINCDDYVNAEYSIDGKVWVSTYDDTYTWNNVESGKSYTVYVRYYATSNKLASACVTNRISTKSAGQNKWDFSSAYSGQIAYVKGTATAEVVYTPTSIEGYFGKEEIANFLNQLADLKKRYDTHGTLRVTFDKTEDYYAPFDVIRYNFSEETISSLRKHGNVRLVCDTDYGVVELYSLATTGDMYVSLEKIYQNTSAGNTHIQQSLRKGSDVYYVEVSTGTDFVLRLPYTHYHGESLTGVTVTYIGSKGGTKTLYPLYLEDTDELCVQAPGNGYYIVERSDSSSGYHPFVDARTSWAKDYISFCYRYGYFQGVTPNTFEPYSQITKAQMLLILSRMEGYSLYGNSHPKYVANFNSKAWWAPGVAWAEETGVMDFSATSTFDPSEPMTREECANVIYKMLLRHNYREVWEMSPARDRNSVSEAYKLAVDYLAQMGVMVGDNTGSFNPKGYVTRAEMATIIYRVNGIL